MIELAPTTALMVYLGFTLSILLALWIYNHYRAKKRKILPIEKGLFVCEYCFFAYLDGGAQKITKCPQCHSYNTSKG